MDKLPVEILRHIFLASLPDRDTITYSTPLSLSVSSPLYISHVCRHWREVSLSYGTLWSYLSLGFKHNLSQTSQEAVVTVFNTWLERTNGCALNFALSCKCYDTLSSETASNIIQTLISERFRWRDVYFDWNLFNPDLRSIDLDGMPMLTSLHLQVNIIQQDCSDFFTRVNLTKSSLVKTLNLDGISDLELGEGSTFVSLKRCHLGFVRVNDLQKAKRVALACLEVLKAAANMTEFSYRPDGFDRLDLLGDGEHPYTARNIKSITLISFCNSVPFVFSALTLPSLQCLRYRANRPDSLLHLVQRSFPSLLAVELSGVCADEVNLVPALRLLPMLQELTICFAKITSWFFEELTRSANASESMDDGPICPNLRSLRLEHIYIFGRDAEWQDALSVMVESRFENLKTFKRVWIRGISPAIRIPDLRNTFAELRNRLVRTADMEVWIDGDIEDPLLHTGMKYMYK